MTDADVLVAPARASRPAQWVVGILAVAALVACTPSDAGSEADSRTTISLANSPTPSRIGGPAPRASASGTTPTTRPIPGTTPSFARAETRTGASAYARFYLEQVNKAFTRGTPEPLEGLAATRCKVCNAFEEGARDMQQAGERHQGTSLKVTSTNVVTFDSLSRTVAIWLTQNSVPVVDSHGRSLRKTKGATGVFLATLKFDRRWSITRLQVVK